MSGAPRCSTSKRRLGALRPRRRHQVGGRADDAGRAGHRRAHRIAQRRDARRNQRAPAGAEHLQIDVVVAGIDRGHHVRAVVLGDQRGGKAGERGEADRRLSGRERDAARGRYPHAQPGEAAGAGGDGDAVELGEFDVGQVHHARDERHQRFGMAARHGERLAGGDPAAVGVEHGGRAGLERGVDGKDAHDQTDSTTTGTDRGYDATAADIDRYRASASVVRRRSSAIPSA